MAVPRLASPRPFWRLDSARLPVTPRRASSIKGAATHGEPVATDEMGHIDLVVCGSVAVDRTGARLGKGGGFSDLEFAFAIEAGLITEETVVATTVHPVQIVDSGRIPLTSHDFPLDLIVTPEAVIQVEEPHSRPSGIRWEDLTPDKIEGIPELERRAPP